MLTEAGFDAFVEEICKTVLRGEDGRALCAGSIDATVAVTVHRARAASLDVTRLQRLARQRVEPRHIRRRPNCGLQTLGAGADHPICQSALTICYIVNTTIDFPRGHFGGVFCILQSQISLDFCIIFASSHTDVHDSFIK